MCTRYSAIYAASGIEAPEGGETGTGSTDTGSTGGGDTGSTDTTPDGTQAPEDSAASGEVACEHTVVANDNPLILPRASGNQ